MLLEGRDVGFWRGADILVWSRKSGTFALLPSTRVIRNVTVDIDEKKTRGFALKN